MKLSAEETFWIADERGFATQPIERMIRLFDVLERFARDDVMGPRMALVGGTALNAFHADLPRLSLDIDIHYMGQGDRVRVEEERPVFEDRALRIMEGAGYSLLLNPRSDTSGRWVFGYSDMQGLQSQLHVDVNYAQRPPFFGTSTLSSAPLGDHRAKDIPVVDKSEIVGGKLKALFSRETARDLFDARTIIQTPGLDWPRARLAALTLGAADRRLDWRKISPSKVNGNVTDIRENLEICLPSGHFDACGGHEAWLDDTVRTCRDALAPMFRLTDQERAFLGAVLDRGVVDASHLDVDEEIRKRIEARPTLHTRAQIVRETKDRARIAEKRQSQRSDTALRLASALTERVRPEGNFLWGDLHGKMERLLKFADGRTDVSQDAVAVRALEVARKRTAADLRLKAVKALNGAPRHEFNARFDGNPRFSDRERRERYKTLLAEGMQARDPDGAVPTSLEFEAARAEVATKGTRYEKWGAGLGSALEFGPVAEAAEIRAERLVLPTEATLPNKGLLKVARVRLLERVFRAFTIQEVEHMAAGQGPLLSAFPDEAARSGPARNFKSLLSVNVVGPAPWKDVLSIVAEKSASATRDGASRFDGRSQAD